MNNTPFEYGGYHFIPHALFQGQDKDVVAHAHNLKLDRELGFASYECKYRKFNYSYDDFYKASTDKQCDIFRCIETGKFYVPCGGDLFEYTGYAKERHKFYER